MPLERIDEVIPYIRSGNAGMDDSLHEVAYAACRDDEDLRDLAERLERLEQDWPLDHARRIYRQIGDREKYLALRSRRMEYGLDIIKAPEEWVAFAREVKRANVRRRAFQEEFAKVVPGWGEL